MVVITSLSGKIVDTMFQKIEVCQAKEVLVYQIGYTSLRQNSEFGAKMIEIRIAEINALMRSWKITPLKINAT